MRDPDNSPAGLIRACLFDTNKMDRYFVYFTRFYKKPVNVMLKTAMGGQA